MEAWFWIWHNRQHGKLAHGPRRHVQLPALRSFLRGDVDAPAVARPGLRAVRVLRQHTGGVGLNLGPGLPVDPGTERRPDARPAELLTNAPVWAVGDRRFAVLCQHATDERTTRFARYT